MNHIKARESSTPHLRADHSQFTRGVRSKDARIGVESSPVYPLNISSRGSNLLSQGTAYAANKKQEPPK